MSKRPPYFPFYAQDFASSLRVEAMTTEEAGAYILLLCKAWHSEPPCSIPNDAQILARWSRLGDEKWSSAKTRVLACFTLRSDGLLYQDRLEAEYRRLRQFQSSQAEKGKAGAVKRWHGHSPGHSTGIAQAIPRDGLSSSPSPSEKDPPNPPRGGRRVVVVSSGFAAFWAAWPPHKRKADRDRCYAKWQALGLEAEAEAVVAKVQAWAASEDWTKDKGQYMPAPLVWLNRGSYTAPAPGETPENARAGWLKSLTDQQRGEMVAEFRAMEKSLPRGTTFGQWAWGKYGPGGES